EDVALGLATEAVEETAVDMHVEARGLLAVERAQALQLRLACRLQAHHFTDDVGEVEPFANEVLGVAFQHLAGADGVTPRRLPWPRPGKAAGGRARPHRRERHPR